MLFRSRGHQNTIPQGLASAEEADGQAVKGVFMSSARWENDRAAVSLSRLTGRLTGGPPVVEVKGCSFQLGIL